MTEPYTNMEIEPVPIEERRAEASTQLGVDEAILDYLTYKATKAVLRDFQKSTNASARDIKKPQRTVHLDLVDSFLVIFRAIHGGYQGSQELQLRLRLLRFATLFTTRQSMKTLKPWTQHLSSLRTLRQRHATNFKSTMYVPDLTEHLPVTKGSSWVQPEHVLGAKIPSRPQGIETFSPPLVSLLDTLPSFMALSAAANVMQESKITDTWMRLAAGYMAQAVIEQYLLYGSRSNKILKEAFAWGFDTATMAEEGSENWAVNAMFLDEEAEFDSWQMIRDEHMRALIPPEDRNLLDHFKMLRENELSLSEFEHTILTFLNGLQSSLTRPVLRQMESKRFEGISLSQYDTQALKDRIGIV